MDDTNNYLIEANELICAGEYQKAEVKLNNVLTLLDKYYPFKYYCLIKLLQNKPQVVDECTVLPKEEPVPFYKNVWLWAILAVCIFAALNIMFW